MKVFGPRGGNLTYNGNPRVGKLTFENLKNVKFPVGCPAPPSWGKPLIGAFYARNAAG